jgi:hypothetical protein
MLFSEKNNSALIIVSAIFPQLAGEGRLFGTLFSGGWGRTRNDVQGRIVMNLSYVPFK